jgi:hypothetical protein
MTYDCDQTFGISKAEVQRALANLVAALARQGVSSDSSILEALLLRHAIVETPTATVTSVINAALDSSHDPGATKGPFRR